MAKRGRPIGGIQKQAARLAGRTSGRVPPLTLNDQLISRKGIVDVPTSSAPSVTDGLSVTSTQAANDAVFNWPAADPAYEDADRQKPITIEVLITVSDWENATGHLWGVGNNVGVGISYDPDGYWHVNGFSSAPTTLNGGGLSGNASFSENGDYVAVLAINPGDEGEDGWSFWVNDVLEATGDPQFSGSWIGLFETLRVARITTSNCIPADSRAAPSGMTVTGVNIYMGQLPASF